MMDRRTAERCIALLKASQGSVRTLDLTGGAPELNSQFRCGLWTSSRLLVLVQCRDWAAQKPYIEVRHVQRSDSVLRMPCSAS